MKKQYKSRKKDIIEALDEIDKFIEKMELFMEKNPNYKYALNIQKDKKFWEILLTITTDE